MTRERLYLDMMQSALGSTSKVVVEPKSGNLLYLPLDKLIQQGAAPAPSPDAAAPAAAAPRAAAPAEAPAAVDAQRSRDSLRRERGG
mgnify:CR=1 FL=1